jgi:hypothetical protein
MSVFRMSCRAVVTPHATCHEYILEHTDSHYPLLTHRHSHAHAASSCHTYHTCHVCHKHTATHANTHPPCPRNQVHCIYTCTPYAHIPQKLKTQAPWVEDTQTSYTQQHHNIHKYMHAHTAHEYAPHPIYMHTQHILPHMLL